MNAGRQQSQLEEAGGGVAASTSFSGSFSTSQSVPPSTPPPIPTFGSDYALSSVERVPKTVYHSNKWQRRDKRDEGDVLSTWKKERKLFSPIHAGRSRTPPRSPPLENRQTKVGVYKLLLSTFAFFQR